MYKILMLGASINLPGRMFYCSYGLMAIRWFRFIGNGAFGSCQPGIGKLAEYYKWREYKLTYPRCQRSRTAQLGLIIEYSNYLKVECFN
jgi:hypothetical protein